MDLVPNIAFGDLSQCSLAEVVAAGFRANATGTIAIEQGKGESRLYMRYGAPVGTALYEGFRPFGDYLVAQGVVDRAALSRHLAAATKDKILLGDVLVREGVLTAARVAELISAHHSDALAMLCVLREGKYELRGWERPPAWTENVRLDPLKAIMAALMADELFDRRQAVLDAVGDHELRMAGDFEALAERLALKYSEVSGIQQLKTPMLGSAFVTALRRDDAEAFVAACVLLGVVEPFDASSQPRGLPGAVGAEMEAALLLRPAVEEAGRPETSTPLRLAQEEDPATLGIMLLKPVLDEPLPAPGRWPEDMRGRLDQALGAALGPASTPPRRPLRADSGQVAAFVPPRPPAPRTPVPPPPKPEPMEMEMDDLPPGIFDDLGSSTPVTTDDDAPADPEPPTARPAPKLMGALGEMEFDAGDDSESLELDLDRAPADFVREQIAQAERAAPARRDLPKPPSRPSQPGMAAVAPAPADKAPRTGGRTTPAGPMKALAAEEAAIAAVRGSREAARAAEYNPFKAHFGRPKPAVVVAADSLEHALERAVREDPAAAAPVPPASSSRKAVSPESALEQLDSPFAAPYSAALVPPSNPQPPPPAAGPQLDSLSEALFPQDGAERRSGRSRTLLPAALQPAPLQAGRRFPSATRAALEPSLQPGGPLTPSGTRPVAEQILADIEAAVGVGEGFVTVEPLSIPERESAPGAGDGLAIEAAREEALSEEESALIEGLSEMPSLATIDGESISPEEDPLPPARRGSGSLPRMDAAAVLDSLPVDEAPLSVRRLSPGSRSSPRQEPAEPVEALPPEDDPLPDVRRGNPASRSAPRPDPSEEFGSDTTRIERAPLAVEESPEPAGPDEEVAAPPAAQKPPSIPKPAPEPQAAPKAPPVAETGLDVRRRLLQRAMRNVGGPFVLREDAKGSNVRRPDSVAPRSETADVEIERDVQQRLAKSAKADHFARLDLEQSAGTDQIKDAFLALAKKYHPDRISAQGQNHLLPQVRDLFARIKESYDVLVDPASRARYVAELAGKSPGGKKVSAEDAKTAYQKALVYLKKRDFKLAEAELVRAVEADPQGEYQAELAWTLLSNPARREAAREEIKTLIAKALKSGTEHERIFVVAAHVARMEGDLDKMEKFFRKALEKNPKSVEAAREIRLIEMRRPPEKTSGLFDRLRKK